MFLGRLDQNCGFHSNRKLPYTFSNGENVVGAITSLFFVDFSSTLQVSRTDINS